MDVEEQHVEIGEDFFRREVIIGAAQLLGEQDGRTRAGGVGAKSGDDREGRVAQNAGRLVAGVLERYRFAVKRRLAHAGIAPLALRRKNTVAETLSSCFEALPVERPRDRKSFPA